MPVTGSQSCRPSTHFLVRRLSVLLLTEGFDCPTIEMPNGASKAPGRAACSLAGTGQELNDRLFAGASRSFSDAKARSGHVLIEAKLNRSIDTIARYQTSLKKDLYRAVAILTSSSNPQSCVRGRLPRFPRWLQYFGTYHEVYDTFSRARY